MRVTVPNFKSRRALLNLAQAKMHAETHVYGCLATLSTYHVDYQQAFLTGSPEISLEWADELTQLFNTHFHRDNLQFSRLNENTWLVQLQQKPDVTVQDYDVIIGKSLFAHLPTGPDKALVHKWFTESQLILNPYFQEKDPYIHQTGYTLWFWAMHLKPKRPSLIKKFLKLFSL